jgi:endonuclease YncB( thermonuclease family)
MKWAAIIPLLALYSSSAVAQAVQEWKVTVQRVSGNNQSCAQGLRGKIGIANGAMSFYLAPGDTIKVDGATYRLWGIDAPELHQSCPDGFPAARQLRHDARSYDHM